MYNKKLMNKNNFLYSILKETFSTQNWILTRDHISLLVKMGFV